MSTKHHPKNLNNLIRDAAKSAGFATACDWVLSEGYCDSQEGARNLVNQALEEVEMVES